MPSRHSVESRAGRDVSAAFGRAVSCALRRSRASSAERQEDGCTGESVPPSNTDAEHRGGLSGLSRRGGGSHSTFFPIERPMCTAAYTQLARQTSALCALGVQPRMRPDVFSCKEPTAKRYTHSYSLLAPCGGVAGQLRASAREAVKGFIPLVVMSPGLA